MASTKLGGSGVRRLSDAEIGQVVAVIQKDAPAALDTFKEVAEKFAALIAGDDATHAAFLAALAGKMDRATYDANGNGKVDTADAIAWSDVTGKPTIPAGNTLVATVNIAETGLVLLALSVRRVNIAVAGAVVGGNYSVYPVNAVPAGFGIVDAVCTVAGTITFGMLVPVITGNYSIPVRVVKVNT